MDAAEQLFTIPGPLGVKWSQVQILSARRKTQVREFLTWVLLYSDVDPSGPRSGRAPHSSVRIVLLRCRKS